MRLGELSLSRGAIIAGRGHINRWSGTRPRAHWLEMQPGRAAEVIELRRRDLLLLATVTTMTRNPALAETNPPRIGFVQVGLRQDNQGLLDAFRENLAALGWTDGSNITDRRPLGRGARRASCPASSRS